MRARARYAARYSTAKDMIPINHFRRGMTKPLREPRLPRRAMRYAKRKWTNCARFRKAKKPKPSAVAVAPPRIAQKRRCVPEKALPGARACF
jgi:hypothetical protein